MAATYSDIVRQISIKQFSPIYVFMGEEPYFIDKLTELIDASILTDDEKVMNETTVFGKDAVIENIITDARQYPIMAPYRVIFIKEAQLLINKKKLALLGKYLEHPVSSTIIVLTYKFKDKDAAKEFKKKEHKEWLERADKLGVVYTSEKIKEYQLTPYIKKMADNEGLSIEDKAINLLKEYIGSELTQLESIMKQFSIMLPTGQRRVSAELIEKVVGISKDYNAFELKDAMLQKDVHKANLIVTHTSSRAEFIVATLFSAYADLLTYMYMPAGTPNEAVEQTLHLNRIGVENLQKASKHYTKRQVFNAIGILRKYDTMSKGVNCPSSSNYIGLLQEMIYKIMH